MTEPSIYSVGLALVGLFPIVASIADWNFFFESRKAKFFVKAFGRNGARLFYGILGLGITTIGVLAIVGVISLEN